jgi:ACS family D-galactonate transporter-like MFS transporter
VRFAREQSKEDTRKWFVVLLLALGMVIAYVDRANLSAVLALKGLRDWIPLDDERRGLLNSAFFWSYALLQIPAGWIVDRFGPKRPYAIGFALWTLACAGAGMAHDIGQLLITRLVLGVGESVSTAASLRWIRLNCAESQRGLATGILFAGTKVGAAIGVPLTVALVFRFGWRMMFALSGVGGLLWLLPWIFFVPERAEYGTKEDAKITAQTQQFRIVTLFAKPVIWGILLGTFAYNYFIYFCLTWLPAYFTEARHLGPTAMGLFTMFSFGGMALVGILAGWAADRIIARGRGPVQVRRLFTMTGFVVASTEVIGMLSKSNDVALFFAVFSLAGLGLATANYWALTQTIFPATTVGRMIGIQNFASNLSGIVASLITGWLKYKTGNYEAAGWTILGVLLLGLTAYGLLVRPDIVESTATENRIAQS